MSNSLDSAFTEILGPVRFRTWSKENPLWWILYRTEVAGHWKKSDIDSFNRCTGSYLIFFHHSREEEARLFSIRILDRCSHFVAAKVSKFAINDEKILALYAQDSSFKRKLISACHEMSFQLYGFREKGGNISPQEQFLSQKWDEYLKALAYTFKGPDDNRSDLDFFSF